MIEEKCVNCKCWKRITEADYLDLCEGICRRYPRKYNTRHPRTKGTEWCGEWRNKRNNIK